MVASDYGYTHFGYGAAAVLFSHKTIDCRFLTEGRYTDA